MNATPRKSTFTRRQDEAPDAIPLPTSKHDGQPAKEVLKTVKRKLINGGAANPRGRPKGSKDKVPRELRAAVLDAGHLAGYDVVVRGLFEEQLAQIKDENPDLEVTAGIERNIMRAVKEVAHGDMVDYLRHQADTNPSAFLSILGKVLPKQIDMSVQLTSRQVLDEMTERRSVLADLRSEVLEAAKGVDYHAEEDGE